MREQTAYHDVSGKLDFKTRKETKQFYYGNGALETEDSPPTLGRLVLRAAPSQWGQGMDLRLVMHDESGMRIKEFQTNIAPRLGVYADYDWEDPESRKIMEAKGKVMKAEMDKSPEITYSPLAIAQSEVFGYQEAKTDAALVTQILDVNRLDPLGGKTSESFTRILQPLRTKTVGITLTKEEKKFTGKGT